MEQEISMLRESLEFNLQTSEEAKIISQKNAKEVESLKKEVDYLKGELRKQNKRSEALEAEMKKEFEGARHSRKQEKG